MTKAFLVVFLIFLGLALAIACLFIFAVGSIAANEPDVNGDPERDAGMSESDLRRDYVWGPTVVCMDCGAQIRAGTGVISHGLCPSCHRRRMDEVEAICKEAYNG